MAPEELEHTREPKYDRCDYWLPAFQPQRYLGMASQRESYETSDTSSSQDGANTPSHLSSRDTTPPTESDIPLCPLVIAEIVGSTRLEEINPSAESKIDGPRPQVAVSLPLVNFMPSVSPMTATNEFVSESALTQDSNRTTLDQRPSLNLPKLENNKAAQAGPDLCDPSAVVSQKNDSESAEKFVIGPKVELRTEPLSDEIASASALSIEAEQNSIPQVSSVAISCPSTVSAIDPPSTRLRHIIAHSPSILLCPGVYDGLSARIALHVGFQGMYMTGAGTTASCLGASDLGIAQLHDMRTNAEMIANLQRDGPPLIADMDTGYGGPLIIRRAVQQYARAGVAAFHIEDQVPEKRCGHLAGKEVVDIETYLGRIKACVYARAQIRSDIVIIARTDALQSRGYDDCVERLRRARDLGADMGILEGVPSKAMAARAVRDLAPWPLCYNSVENGHSPLITAAEAQEMGYRVMIFSFAGIAPAYAAILETFTRLKEQGVTGSVVGPKTIFEVCGLEEEMRTDEAVGGMAFAKGV